LLALQNDTHPPQRLHRSVLITSLYKFLKLIAFPDNILSSRKKKEEDQGVATP